MWYYKDGEIEVGPVSKDELVKLLKDRKIGGRTMLRSARGKQWKPLHEMVKKKSSPPASPPPPQNPVSKEAVVTSTEVPLPPKPSTELKKQRIPFQFTGSGSEYFKIWIVNIVLSVLTLGIYSAWAKVRRKQYFYGNTKLAEASFSYLADPVKILKGRLIVFAVFLVYSLINQFFPLAGAILLLLLLPLLPWFVVRALSFNARNSAVRNIRFTFQGTYFEAAKVFLFWPILLPFTLGFIFPYLLYRQKKFLVDNSTYGTTPFAFEATPKDYYMLFVGLLLPLVICVAAGIGSGFFVSFAPILFFIVFYLYAMAFIAVKANNLLYNSSTLAVHGFHSTMAIKDYVIIVVTNTIATMLSLGFFHPFAQVRTYRYRIEHLTLLSAGDLDQFVAAEREQVSALGDEAADFLDFDIGI